MMSLRSFAASHIWTDFVRFIQRRTGFPCVGDFSPLANFTVTEVKAIGRALGLPERLVEKPPSDGLCGKTDEDNLGFTYAALDLYIREGIEPDPETKALIDRKHKMNLFKLKMMPAFPFNPVSE